MENNIDVKQEDLEIHLGFFKKGSRGHLIGKCPYCGKDDHFYIRYRNDDKKTGWFWDCKKCKEEGNIFKLFSYLGVLQQYIKKPDVKLDKLTSLIVESTNVEEEKIDLHNEEKRLPIGFRRVFEDDYLSSRHFLAKDFYKLNIGKTILDSKLKHYIIFSIDEDGVSKGTVSRCLLSKEEMEAKGLKRYENSEKTSFGSLIYGYDEITEDTETVIVVEGIFDKVRLDNLLETDLDDSLKVVSTFGNKISKAQMKKINRFGNIDLLYLFYDLDAIKQMKKYSEDLKSEFKKVRIICLSDGKDASDSNDESIFSAIENSYSLTEFLYDKINIQKIKI